MLKFRLNVLFSARGSIKHVNFKNGNHKNVSKITNQLPNQRQKNQLNFSFFTRGNIKSNTQFSKIHKTISKITNTLPNQCEQLS